MSAELYVDPEGLLRLAQMYRDEARKYREQARQVAALRTAYWNSWGNDELGQQFSEKYVAGLNQLEAMLISAAETLEYTADGLELTATTFRDAHDDAGETSVKLRNLFDTIPAGPGNNPGFPSGDLRPARILASRPLLRTSTATLVDGEIQPVRLATEAPPLGKLPYGTLTSAMFMSASMTGDVVVDGVPLDDRYTVICFKEIAPGTVRVDMSRYSSITPLGPQPDVRFGGTPFTPEDGLQVFIVERFPADAPIPNGPHEYVNYYSDGSSEPYGTARA